MTAWRRLQVLIISAISGSILPIPPPVALSDEAPQKGHAPPAQIFALEPADHFVKGVWLVRTSWSLAHYATDSPRDKKLAKYQPHTSAEVVADFGRYLQRNDVESHHARHKLARKYGSEIKESLASLTLLGRELPWFLYDEYNPPITFVRKDGAICAVLDRVGFPVTYNTLKLTTKRRASEVVQSAILPSLRDLKPILAVPKIKCLGFVLAYGSKDFSSNRVRSLQPEALALMCPANDVSRFIDGALSQEALMTACDVFLSDRDMVSSVKKITLQLE